MDPQNINMPPSGTFGAVGFAEQAVRASVAMRIAGQNLRLAPDTRSRTAEPRASYRPERVPGRPQRVRSSKAESETDRAKKVASKSIMHVRALPDLERNRRHLRYLRMLQVRLEAMSYIDRNVVRAVAQQCFNEPALEDAAMKFARDVLREDGQEEAARALDEALGDLEKEAKPQIKAGKNISEKATPFVEQGLGTYGRLRQLYTAVVLDYHNVGEAFILLKKQAGEGDLNATLQFLTIAVGADLAALEPSCDRGQLEAVVNDFYQVRFLDGFHQEMMQLQARLAAQYRLLNPGSVLGLTEKVLVLVNQEFINPEDVRQLPREAGCAETEAEIYFFTQLHGKTRLIPLKIFRGEQPREMLLETIQSLLDEKIKEQEAAS
jgi:type III secretion protein W